MINETRQKIRSELEAPVEGRHVGTGWLSGVAGFIGAIIGIAFVVCLKFPDLTIPAIRPYYEHAYFRFALHALLIIVDHPALSRPLA